MIELKENQYFRVNGKVYQSPDDQTIIVKNGKIMFHYRDGEGEMMYNGQPITLALIREIKVDFIDFEILTEDKYPEYFI
jgi:hypothetical protein